MAESSSRPSRRSHEIELDPGETVIAEAGAMLPMEDGVQMETRMVDGSQRDQGFMGKLFEGVKREGLFFATLTGPGRAWLQSLPFSRLANRIYSAMPRTP